METARFHQFANVGKLLRQLVRGLVPTALVVIVHFRPKSDLSGIESYQGSVRVKLIQDVVQHQLKAINSCRMQTILIGKLVNLVVHRKKCPKDNAVSID